MVVAIPSEGSNLAVQNLHPRAGIHGSPPEYLTQEANTRTPLTAQMEKTFKRQT
jgi:hypothetical protein